LGDRSADEQCSPLHARIGAGAWSRREMRIRIWWRRGWCVAYVIRTDRRGTHPVGVDDSQGTSFASLIDPSRSAIVGVSGFWICQRFCRLSKMRACIAAVTCWRMWSCATTAGCVCRGEHRSSAVDANDNTTPMQIRKTQSGTYLHRRVLCFCCFRGRPMAAPTAKHAPRRGR